MAKIKFLTFQAQPVWVRVISSSILYVNVDLEKFSMIKMVLLDQSNPISLYSKIKNKNFVNWTFIIHKNGNKTGIQPILKSNSTSFMLNIIFCEMKGKKVIHWGILGGAGGMGEPS